MCHGNKGKDWYDVTTAIKGAQGNKLSGTTPGVEFTGFTETAGKQATSDLVAGSNKSSLSHFASPNFMHKQRFRDWYDPMFETIVSDPAKALMGEETSSGIGGMNKFVSAQSVLESAGIVGQQAQDMLSAGQSATQSGASPMLLKKDKEAFGASGLKLEGAKAEFAEEETAISEGRTGAEEAKKEGLLSTKIERQKALSESIPEYEKSRAGLAKSGIAYSGPAMAAVEASEESRKIDMGDLARESAGIMKDYRDTISGLDTKQSVAESKMERDRKEFNLGLGSLLRGTQDEATSMLAQAASIPGKWKDYGETLGTGGLVGSAHYGGGWRGRSDMFEEQTGDVESLGRLTDLVTDTGKAATAMADLLGNPVMDETEGDVQ